MKVEIAFLNLEHTEALDQKIKEKSERILKFFPDAKAKWTCSVSNGEHFAEVKINGPRSQYYASAKTKSLYKTLDKVIHKIEKQIAKHKDVSKVRIRKEEEMVYLEPEKAWLEYDYEEENLTKAS